MMITAARLLRPVSPGVEFEHQSTGLGRLALRPLCVPDDIPRIYDWVIRDYAHYWNMQQKTYEEVEAFYVGLTQSGHARAYMGLHEGVPAFLVEVYDPAHDQVGEHYEVKSGDRGMHVLVGPAERPLSGFTLAVMRTIMMFLFRDPGTSRVVVEPDIRNEKIHVLNRLVGFTYDRPVTFREKTAHLAFCTRDQYAAALQGPMAESREPTHMGFPAHLTPGLWAKVNRLLVRKAIAEFSHELLIVPRLLGREGDWDRYVLETATGDPSYRFRARRLALDHWLIDTASLEKWQGGVPAAVDALHFIIEFRTELGIASAMLPIYLEEISSTLYGSAYKHAGIGRSAAELARADFQAIEAGMMEGHPTFVANNGRIGFDANDYGHYAPEAGSPTRIIWLAVTRTKANFSCVPDLTYEQLMHDELGEDGLAQFEQRLRALSLDPADYAYMPAHPWQWFNKLAITFASEIAARDIVYLGQSGDTYRAQQSIRTFFNVSQPHKCYVKTALSILNMGFMRGLSPDYMRATPAINAWLARLIEHDAYLQANGFEIIREVAAIGYRNPHFEAAIEKGSPYGKMLSALWRESPVARLAPGQRLMTMAALLHIGPDDEALVGALIAASGLDAGAWIRRYLDAYLAPLVHCFYAHDLAFMPHGENLILVIEDGVPARVIMKDIGEEIGILNGSIILPEEISRIAFTVRDEMKLNCLFTDVFDCFFRYLAAILDAHSLLPEERFWRSVAYCIRAYQAAHPQYREKYTRYDLFAPEFTRNCLNRLQLNNTQQMLDLLDPEKSLQFIGTLQNPLAPFAGMAAPEPGF